MILTKDIITKNVTRNIRPTIEHHVEGFNAKPSVWGGVRVMNVSLRLRFFSGNLLSMAIRIRTPQNPKLARNEFALKRFIRESVF
jgi:hypothetical protein